MSGELSEFLQVCCGVPILEGYGLTETGAACSLTLNNGHTVYYTVGAPLYGHEIRLQSLPTWATPPTTCRVRAGRSWCAGPPCSRATTRTPR